MQKTKKLTTLLITLILIIVSFSNNCYAAFYANSQFGKALYANYNASRANSVLQGNTMWCWAAAVTNANHILGKRVVAIKDVVQLGTGKKNVKATTPGTIEDTDRALNKLNIKHSHTKQSLSIPKIKENLKKGSPIMARLNNPKRGVGHMITIIGFVESTNSLIYLDSNYRQAKSTSYSAYKALWTDTFYNLK